LSLNNKHISTNPGSPATRKMTLTPFLFMFIFSSLSSDYLKAEEIMVNGQASAWVGYTDDWRGGIRYVPQLSLSGKVLEESHIDAEISLNAYIFDDDTDLKLYRSWLRYSTERFEMRLGLQKISFGPAKILRSLMWFDQLDVRDPLELTDGVYALLGRYYFLNNANIWVWGLYGNDDLKGLETFETDEDSVELGGRYQFPVPRGEMAFSFHHRNIDKNDWKGKMSRSMSNGTENRYAIDASFDVGVGLWFEASAGEIGITTRKSGWEKFLTLGTDYTFDISSGIHVLYEHFIESSDSEISEEDRRYSLSALSLDFSIGVLDSVNVIGYYDWEEKKTYAYLGWQRTYDNWMVNLSIFSSRKDETSLYSGNGFLCMLTYNH